MIISSRLSLIFEVGTDEHGEAIFQTKSFNNVKDSASNEQLLAIANAISSLQQYSLSRVERTNVHSLL